MKKLNKLMEDSHPTSLLTQPGRHLHCFVGANSNSTSCTKKEKKKLEKKKVCSLFKIINITILSGNSNGLIDTMMYFSQHQSNCFFIALL